MFLTIQKNPFTFLLSLTFLFLYPSISFSQTFKCEFVSEKFLDGKTNRASCSGDPELTIHSSRTPHCGDGIGAVTRIDYKDYVVDLKNKNIKYKSKTGTLKEGNYKTNFERTVYGTILDVQSFNQNVYSKESGEENTISLLIVYSVEGADSEEKPSSLYIPQNGKSIISEYSINFMTDHGDMSWVGMMFGKCVNTSN
jgi:hypothetical protein